MAKSRKHVATDDGNAYQGSPIGSGVTVEPTKQHPSVKKLHRPNQPAWGGNQYDPDRSYIKGPAAQPNPVGNVASKKDSAL